jgi:uncharacterized membrane protein YeiH
MPALALSLPVPPVVPAAEVFALIGALDPVGIAIGALSGALLAAKMNQTFVTMSFFAVVTGVGGGSVRDLLIGAPVFWVHDGWTAPVCLSVALIVWFTPARLWREGTRVIEWADAAGLGAYAVLGTAKAPRQ